MSFSKDIKQELSKIDKYNKEILLAELIGFIYCGNTIEKSEYYEYVTENEFNIEHLYKILFNLELDYEPAIKGKYYVTKIPKVDLIKNIEKDINEVDDNFKRNVLKGCFLGSGYINNPEKNYHLEIVFINKKYCDYIKNVCSQYEIEMKEIYVGEKYQLYLKDAEDISSFLAVIGANKAVLNFEDIRVIKEMKNNVNRKVNCETANLNKTLDAALKQIDDIKVIKRMRKFSNLPKELQEVANLRIENPELGLKDLGKLLTPELGKSGVNSRLKKIHEIAEGLK